MKKGLFLLAAASVLILAAGCNNNTSMDNQSTNAPAEQPPPAMNTNAPSGIEMTNAVHSTAAVTNSAGMDTNNPARTNGMNTTTNAAPP